MDDQCQLRKNVGMYTIPPDTDPLGEGLHYLRMVGVFYSRCEFAAPWGLVLPPIASSLMFHVVLAGACWLDVEGAEPRLLRPGDLSLVPHGEGHQLASALGLPGIGLLDVPRVVAGDRYEHLRIAGEGPLTHMVCGAVRFEHPAARQLVALLPRQLVVDSADTVEREWIQNTLRFMAAEARRQGPGGETVLSRLADVLVIQAIRSWIERDPLARTGWLGAMRDPQVGHALRLIHRDPARAWTVASLADAVAMSRSAFAARFAALVGDTPARYLTRWRMNLAASLLRDGVAVGEVAVQCGYESEAAFHRAFKRITGTTPGAMRSHRDPALAGSVPERAVDGVQDAWPGR